MRRPVWIIVLLTLADCRSTPKTTSNTPIKITEFLGTKENCGLIHSVRPVYPKEAKQARIEGDVHFSAVITKTGAVSELRLLSGNPALVPAAFEAVRQRRYAPCRMNGESVEVKTRETVQFSLRQ